MILSLESFITKTITQQFHRKYNLGEFQSIQFFLMNRISIILQALSNFFAIRISAEEGSKFPLGWLCAIITVLPLQSRQAEISFFEFITQEVNPSLGVMLKEAIDKHENIVILADRLSDENSRKVKVNFLGMPASFPQGPWILANVLKAPIRAITTIIAITPATIRFPFPFLLFLIFNPH